MVAAFGGSVFLPSFLKSTPLPARHRRLVIIHLSGGNDWYNTIIPIRNDKYVYCRPNIHIPFQDCLQTNEGVGLHPSLMQLWHWFKQGNGLVLNITEEESYLHHRAQTDKLLQLFANVRTSRMEGNLQAQLQDVYNHLDANNIFRVTHEGYDTHVSQVSKHASLLKELDNGLHRFLLQLDRSGQLQHTLIMIVSEFGRTLEENPFGGTDHDCSNRLILIGSGINDTSFASLSANPSLTWADIHSSVMNGWLS